MSPGRFLTVLVLASSLILVLPRGWCCIFAALAAKQAAPAPRSCCSGGGEDPAPPEDPRPQPAKRCMCAGRDTVLPHQPELPTAEPLAFAAAPALPAPAPFAPLFLPPLKFSFAQPPLQALNCVWLC